MLIRKEDTVKEVDEPGVQVLDYRLPMNQIGLSYQELDARVPAKGAGVNEDCEERYYIIEGRATVWIDDQSYEAKAGDLVVIRPGQGSYLIAKNLKMLTVTSPDWYAGQHTIVSSSVIFSC